MPVRLSSPTRRAVLTAHILISVGLLGEVSAFLAIAARAAGTEDPAFASASYDLLAMFQLLFGIPLSFGALATGPDRSASAASGASCATRG